MTTISAPAVGPSYFSQGEGSPSPLHSSVGQLVNWVSSELHSFFGANNVFAPIVVPSQAYDSKIPEPAHVNDPQSHPEAFTTFVTAIIPFSGRAFPARVILHLVPLPLHLGTGQYPSSLNQLSPPYLGQGGDQDSFPPPQPPQPSGLSADYSTTRGDATKDPAYLEYAPAPGSFSIAPQNPIPGPEIHYGYQPSRVGPDDPAQEPIPDGTIAAGSPLHDVAVYPPPFNLTPGSYLVPGHSLSSSLVNRSLVPTAHTTHQNERKSRQSTSRQLGQAHEDTPSSLTTAGPIRGVGENQRHQCTKCNASYVRLSGLNRHYKDKHSAWMACHRCSSEFSLGRMYKFTEHLQTCPGA